MGGRGSGLRQSREPAESRWAEPGGGQDPGQVVDRCGEIELGGGLLTPHVPGLPQTPLHQPGQAMPHGGGGDTVRKPHCVGVRGRPATGLPAGAD